MEITLTKVSLSTPVFAASNPVPHRKVPLYPVISIYIKDFGINFKEQPETSIMCFTHGSQMMQSED